MPLVVPIPPMSKRIVWPNGSVHPSQYDPTIVILYPSVTSYHHILLINVTPTRTMGSVPVSLNSDQSIRHPPGGAPVPPVPKRVVVVVIWANTNRVYTDPNVTPIGGYDNRPIDKILNAKTRPLPIVPWPVAVPVVG